jgi:hypothetical protein
MEGRASEHARPQGGKRKELRTKGMGSNVRDGWWRRQTTQGIEYVDRQSGTEWLTWSNCIVSTSNTLSRSSTSAIQAATTAFLTHMTFQDGTQTVTSSHTTSTPLSKHSSSSRSSQISRPMVAAPSSVPTASRRRQSGSLHTRKAFRLGWYLVLSRTTTRT